MATQCIEQFHVCGTLLFAAIWDGVEAVYTCVSMSVCVQEQLCVINRKRWTADRSTNPLLPGGSMLQILKALSNTLFSAHETQALTHVLSYTFGAQLA